MKSQMGLRQRYGQGIDETKLDSDGRKMYENNISIFENIMLILLTCIGIHNSSSPVFLIMTGAVLMMRVTYMSLDEEKTDRKPAVVDFVLMSAFSLLSGSFTGALVFFFLRDISIYIRMSLGMIMMVLSQILFEKESSAAMCVLKGILCVIGFFMLVLLYRMLESARERRAEESRRLVESNISELHEKQMNEQLVAQRYMSEKNARLLEREDISRNIHNSVGHSITAAIMTLDAADMLYEVRPDEARQKMNAANERIRGSLESIRRAVRVLDEDNALLTAKDLKAELDMVISGFVMDTSIEAYSDYAGMEDEITILHDHVVFLTGAVGEFLTNGVKHGGADMFSVILYGDAAHVRVEVTDNGSSDFADDNSNKRIKDGFGLKKIISYAERYGGKTSFVNDGGFKAAIELPCAIGGKHDE